MATRNKILLAERKLLYFYLQCVSSQTSVLNDNYTFFLLPLFSEGQAGDSWELGNKAVLNHTSGTLE